MAELKQVYQPTASAGKPRIVFIHGLAGDMRNTWMSDPKDEATLWPTWLGEETQCPVWLLGYGAAVSRWKSDAMALPRQATAILERLATESALTSGPIVLVGHSLGGLVIKTALKQGFGRDVERHKRLVQRIKGIAFIGTPHFGSKLASIASWFRILRTNPQVRDLALDDPRLEELNQLFVNMLRDLSIQIRVYSETQPLRLPGVLRFLPFGTTIVSPSSSQPHVPGEVGIPIEADHVSICKPKDRDVGLYPLIKAFIDDVQKASIAEVVSIAHDSFEALTSVTEKIAVEYSTASHERRDALSQHWTSVVSSYKQAVADVREIALTEVKTVWLQVHVKEILTICDSETRVGERSPFQLPPSNPWKFKEQKL